MTQPGTTNAGVEDVPTGSPRTLLAVLASPPTTAGTRTLNQVRVAAGILDCQHLRVVNLFPVPTRDVPAISALGTQPEVWLAGRAEVAAAFRDADAVVAGWGVTAPVGPARGFMREQVAWFAGAAEDAGIPEVWTVGGQPRHPSRWHRYVADRYGRVTPGSPTERLAQVLVAVPVGTLAG